MKLKVRADIIFKIARNVMMGTPTTGNKSAIEHK